MKLSPVVIGAVGLAGHAAAFWGKLSSDVGYANEGGYHQTVTLKDYRTKSEYKATISSFTYCTSKTPCDTKFYETGGGYDWPAQVYQTDDGCYNVNFKGAFDNAQHGYCCGNPCNIGA